MTFEMEGHPAGIENTSEDQSMVRLCSGRVYDEWALQLNGLTVRQQLN
jgi:hypothetical protein